MKSKILDQDSKKDTHNWKKNVCEWSRNRDSTDQHAEDEASHRNGTKWIDLVDEELCEARWGEFDSDGTRDSDKDMRPGVQMKMNVQWIWMRSRQSWRRRRVLRIFLYHLCQIYGALQIGRRSAIREGKADERRNAEEGR